MVAPAAGVVAPPAAAPAPAASVPPTAGASVPPADAAEGTLPEPPPAPPPPPSPAPLAAPAEPPPPPPPPERRRSPSSVPLPPPPPDLLVLPPPSPHDGPAADDEGNGVRKALPDDPAPPAKAPSGKPDKSGASVELHGYVQVRFDWRPDTNDSGTADPATVYVPRARLAAKGRIVPGVRFQVEGDLAEPAHPLKDGYISLDMIPHHRLRIGQQKTPFGYENRLSSTRLLVVRRSEVTERLARGPDSREIGAQLIGDWELPAGWEVGYAVAVVNGAGANVVIDDTPRKNVFARVGAGWKSPDKAVAVDAGVSYGNGDRLPVALPGETPIKYTFDRLGADLQIEIPYALAIAEYISGTDRRLLGPVHAHGFYALLAARTPWNTGPLLRYQTYDPDRDVAGEQLRRFTLGAYYDLVPVRARLLVNYDIDRSTPRRDDGLFVQAQAVF